MMLRQLWHPRTLMALGALIALLAIAACGGTATPNQAGDSGGGETARHPDSGPVRRCSGTYANRAAGCYEHPSAGSHCHGRRSATRLVGGGREQTLPW